MENRRLDLTGLTKPSKTCGFTGMELGFDRPEAAGRLFGWVWTQTETFFWSKPRPLARYPDPLLTLLRVHL